MTFIKSNSDPSKLNDQVFALAEMADGDSDPNKINATLGSLLDEKGELLAFKSVYEVFDKLDDKIKASYAQGALGNQDYLEAVEKHVLEDRVNLYRRLLATSGGTGAITLAFKNIPEAKDTVLVPHIAWGSYKTIAQDYGLKIEPYDTFKIDDLIMKAQDLSKKQNRLLLVINSPCHNPTGMSYTDDEWRKLFESLKKIDRPCVVLNDIAYLDYCYDLDKGRSYLKTFNEMGDKTMVIIAFSLSKTFTAYGLRTGADIIIAKDPKSVDEVANVFERSCRALWSNVNNAAMETFAKVIKERHGAFIKEKDTAIRMLEKRAKLFISKLDELAIPYYPYEDGFFVTIAFEDDHHRDKAHAKLLDSHVYSLKVNQGIRIALCSVPLSKLESLALAIKKAL